jgi:glycosyltransferase involved in cell wall biosynthesis
MSADSAISACIPCFNAERTLRQAVESIRRQSVGVRELLIVDDGSSDRSPEIGAAIADRQIRFPKNLGRGAARQRAVEEARGEYILFCDATVALEPTFLEGALKHFTSERVAGVFGQVSAPASESVSERWCARHLFKTGAKRGVQRQASLMSGGALLKRSAVMQAGGFNTQLEAGEDQELGERMLRAGCEVISDPDLGLITLRRDGLLNLLRRYARWNCAPGHAPSWREYRKSIGYHASLTKEDLAARDLPCAVLTLFAPHFIFWSRRMGQTNRLPEAHDRHSFVKTA